LKNEGYAITEIDVDREKEKAEKYAITSLPTVVVLQNTKIIKRFVGKTTEEELKKVLTKNDYQIW
jgi:thioredoxin-like negative regulator of GroEL